MTWIELITIKAFSSCEASEIVQYFYSIIFSRKEEQPKEVSLLRSCSAPNNFCIRITWQGQIQDRAKSALGGELEEGFSRLGRIHHSAWLRETGYVFVA